MRLVWHIASFKLMNCAAATALEMMMMRLSSNLIAYGTAGDLNRGEPLILDEVRDIPIDRSNAQGVRSPLSEGKSLVWRERAVLFEEGCADGLLLSCFSSLDLPDHLNVPCSNNNAFLL